MNLYCSLLFYTAWLSLTSLLSPRSEVPAATWIAFSRSLSDPLHPPWPQTGLSVSPKPALSPWSSFQGQLLCPSNLGQSPCPFLKFSLAPISYMGHYPHSGFTRPPEHLSYLPPPLLSQPGFGPTPSSSAQVLGLLPPGISASRLEPFPTGKPGHLCNILQLLSSECSSDNFQAQYHVLSSLACSWAISSWTSWSCCILWCPFRVYVPWASTPRVREEMKVIRGLPESLHLQPLGRGYVLESPGETGSEVQRCICFLPFSFFPHFLIRTTAITHTHRQTWD